MERWLRYAAAYQPVVTDETAESVRGTNMAILCTREEWQKRLRDSPTIVSLSGTNLRRIIPLPTAIMRKVRRLELYCCNITHLPDAIGQLTHLTHLYLEFNRLASLPDAIGGVQT